MTVNVNIKNDPEIKKQVRELIAEEVKCLTKKYFHEVINETVKEYLFRMTQKDIKWDDKYHNPFIYAVEQSLKHHLDVGWDGKLQVQHYINEYFNKNIDKWMPDIDIKDIQKLVEKAVKNDIISALS
jgi:uncharacterized membrane protein YheB (UPF0754 family)